MVLATALIRPDDVVVETEAAPGAHFHIGSNAKAMTATPCAIAGERGLLTWGAVTPLLSHSAGIPPLTEDDELAGYPHDRRAAAERLLQSPKVERGTYSNGGYVVAASLLEQATGSTWERLLVE